MSYDLSKILFSINGNDFTCSEFLDALKHYGLLEAWQERVQEGKHFIQKAGEEKLELDLEVLGEMTSDFRYSEKLLSSDDFSEWLLSLNMQLSDFENFLIRRYWISHFAEEDASEFQGEVCHSEILAEMYFSGAFKGLLDSWLSRLLAWYDEHSAKPESFDELETEYKKYKTKLEKYFDKELWLDTQEGCLEKASLDDLQELFFDEVWKTLKVKYVS